MDPMDPSLRRVHDTCNRSQDQQTRQPPPPSSSEPDPGFHYYQLKNQKVERVCPFSDASRPNACVDYATPRERKDATMKHLQKKKADPDAQHPADDELWQSPRTLYLMTPRPKRFDAHKRKCGIKQSSHRYYKKRAKRQDEVADDLKAQYERDEITVEEYQKVLIGHRRRELQAERRLKERLEQVAADNELIIRRRLKEKAQELRCSTANDTQIQEVENARRKHSTAESQVRHHRQQISRQSARVVEFFSRPQFLESDQSFLDFHSFDWPDSVSIGSFYQMATVLLPQSKWSGQVHGSSSMRQMKKTLHDYNEAEKKGMVEEDYPLVDQVVKIFNASCDLVEAEEGKISGMSIAGAQAWLDKQDAEWREAQRMFSEKFALSAHPALEQARLIDDLAEMYRELKDSEEDAAAARRDAQHAVG